MNKLRLHLDDLTVESFDTTTVERPRGTVYGEQCSCETVCSCPGCPTCDATCPETCDDYTCAASCEGTCAEMTCFTRCVDTCICQ